ncbi:MAG TPA: ureidoglycolate lyase [Oscillatoriales cyanobacterium M59_W2019_021]|nr:MAG: Ureidoglycolate hydrolase [Cyanobacteria bacterium J055]HIK34010.1 ureidoglycolate lyase [Oscillatoriales cyanobacterium M4454_W2019_049]HIK50264.1 ureidoglycolate lyase [Oscillatoriales cyanobacterium M59_W2019_021]
MIVPKSPRSLPATWIDAPSFQPYGQVISASADGKLFDETEAQLELSQGIPRFYIMRLQSRGRYFDRITRHVCCTQCLGSLEGKEWLMAVAPPSESDRPDLNQLRAFKIPGNCFIKLEVGTWHAGPLFDAESINFYNLELSDTNITDHFTYDFLKNDGISFEII